MQSGDHFGTVFVFRKKNTNSNIIKGKMSFNTTTHVYTPYLLRTYPVPKP